MPKTELIKYLENKLLEIGNNQNLSEHHRKVINKNINKHLKESYKKEGIK